MSREGEKKETGRYTRNSGPFEEQREGKNKRTVAA
jgi:hypothetical protein